MFVRLFFLHVEAAIFPQRKNELPIIFGLNSSSHQTQFRFAACNCENDPVQRCIQNLVKHLTQIVLRKTLTVIIKMDWLGKKVVNQKNFFIFHHTLLLCQNETPPMGEVLVLIIVAHNIQSRNFFLKRFCICNLQYLTSLLK